MPQPQMTLSLGPMRTAQGLTRTGLVRKHTELEELPRGLLLSTDLEELQHRFALRLRPAEKLHKSPETTRATLEPTHRLPEATIRLWS